MPSRKSFLFIPLLTLFFPVASYSATAVTQHGITWRFERDHETGQYVNGDYWVVGPVRVVEISNALHADGFTPGAGQDGSMINPPTTDKQGYDDSLVSYVPVLNVSHPGGQPISAENPLRLKVDSSLVSAVSWLYRSKDDTEPGCPRFNGGTKTPRPVLRAAAILTCVKVPPAPGSFRPPYCGTEKSSRFHVRELKMNRLKNLAPVGDTPDHAGLEEAFAHPWIDHVNQYLGAFVHPSENMPEYGQFIAQTMGSAALMLHLDFDQLPGKPRKKKLLVRFVQLGIDLAGVADHGGSWPSNGGHHMGRKWPILFAGVMLDDEHMQGVGQWETAFQEDDDTFYVSEAEVAMTHSSQWAPDKRAPAKAYTRQDIGLPEWGIRHTMDPELDNKDWAATYRNINNSSYPGFVLAALIMGQKKAWNHNALFDYVDRAVAVGDPKHPAGDRRRGHYVFGGDFTKNMWQAYRTDYGCVWVPDDPASSSSSNTSRSTKRTSGWAFFAR